MPKKGKRKNAAPLLVAPEPLGDELETDIMWDYVKKVNDKPFFMDGTLVDATRGAFGVEKNDKNSAEAVRNAFMSETRHLDGPRACELFEMGELELMELMKNTEQLKCEADGFQLLKESEAKEREVQKTAADGAARRLLTELSDERLILLEDMQDEADKFFEELGQIMESVCSLSANEALIESVFLEQQNMREEYRLSEKKYYREKGDHVVHMRQMKEQTRKQQHEMITSMVNRLETGVDEATKLSGEDSEDKFAPQEERSLLLVELVKLQAHSTALEKKTSAISFTRADIQREIALEQQKHKICLERQSNLQKELKSLADTVRENNLKILEANSAVTSTDAYASTLPMVPTSPNTIADLNTLGEQKSLSLLTIEARRELEEATAELTSLQNTFWALRRQHLLQLSGQYQSVNLDSSFQTAENLLLDAETNAAVRSIVVDSLLEISQSLREPDSVGKPNANLKRLLTVTDPKERKAIQDLVAKRINKLFSCVCPTAPPLLFLREASHVQSSI